MKLKENDFGQLSTQPRNRIKTSQRGELYWIVHTNTSAQT